MSSTTIAKTRRIPHESVLIQTVFSPAIDDHCRVKQRTGPLSIETWYSWWVAALALLIASISFGAVTSVPILLKPMSREWGVSVGTLSHVYTTTMLCGGVGSLVLGRMLDRYGFFRLAIGASCATALGLFLASRATNLLALHLSYGILVGGIGQGVFFSALAAALARWFDRNQAMAVAVAASGQSVGGLTIPPVLRWGADQFGWRMTLEWYAAVAIVVLICCAFGFRRTPPSGVRTQRRERAAPSAQRIARRRSAFWILGACLAMFNLVTFTAVGHLVAFGEERGFAPVAAAALVSALLGSTLVSRLAVGVLFRIWGTFRVMLAFSLVQVVGITWLAAAQGYGDMAAAACVVGLGFGGYLPGYALLAASMFPASESGRRTSEIYCFGFLSAGVGSSLGGWLRDARGGYEATFTAIALIAWISIAVLYSQRGRFLTLERDSDSGATAAASLKLTTPRGSE